MKFTTGVIWFFLLASLVSAAVEPVSRTDKIIQEEHAKTQEFCKTTCQETQRAVEKQYYEEKDSLLRYFNEIIWFDRVLTAIGIFAVVMAANSLSQLVYRRNLRKYETLLAKYKGWQNYDKQRDKSGDKDNQHGN